MAGGISIVNLRLARRLTFLLFVEPISELIKSFEYITDYVMLMDLIESNFTINRDNHKK